MAITDRHRCFSIFVMLATVLRRLAARGPPALWQVGPEQAAAGALGRLTPTAYQLHNILWVQGSGFSSSPCGGGSGGGTGDSARPAPSEARRVEEVDEQQQQPRKENQAEQPQQQQSAAKAQSEEHQGPADAQQKGPSAAPSGDQAAAAAAGSGPAGSADGEPPTFGEVHPELKKYIDQLKQLKGKWGGREDASAERPLLACMPWHAQ